MKRLLIVACLAGFSGLLTANLWWPARATGQFRSNDFEGADRPSGRGGNARSLRSASASAPVENAYTPEELANIRVYEVANQSVVNINTSTVQYDRFFMLPIPGEGSGSGAVLDAQGHILTNYHVVRGAREIEVTLASGNHYDAQLVGSDPETDIAVLRIEAPGSELFPIELGRSDGLKVGQRVYALGNPFGLNGTLTTGIISSLNRTPPGGTRERALKSLIQTDAAMNPGNSGGPLLDTGARVIGMNVAIATKTGQNAGVGFAIPVDRIRRIVPELIREGRVIRADHGIVTVMETDRGLRIVKLTRDGPAERAGLRGWRVIRKRSQRGNVIYQTETIDKNSDYILAIDGTPIATHHQFQDLIEQYEPGDTATFTIQRDGVEQQVAVTLGGN